MKTTLLVPVLNEIEGLKLIMPLIDRAWVDQILILDGQSTDGSAQWARGQGYEVYVQKKPGLKNGYLEVWGRIRGDIVITFSPDGNSIPELIPSLVVQMWSGYDMVIVSRYKGGAKSHDDDVVTAFGNWMFTRLVNLLFRGGYTDAMVMFRAYRKDLIYELDLDKSQIYFVEMLFRTKISWEPILSVLCAKNNLRIAEIPGDEPPRVGGVRKLQVIRWGLAYLTQILCVYFRRKNDA